MVRHWRHFTEDKVHVETCGCCNQIVIIRGGVVLREPQGRPCFLQEIDGIYAKKEFGTGDGISGFPDKSQDIKSIPCFYSVDFMKRNREKKEAGETWTEKQ